MRSILPLAIILVITTLPVRADTAVIPVSFDYPLLQSLLVKRHFTDDNQTAVVLNDDGGCRKVVLSNPRLIPLGWALRTTADVTVRTGVVMMGKCLSPDTWEGVIDIDQRMEIEPGTAKLRFVTMESYVHGSHGKTSALGSLLYGALKERVHERLDRFAIDLTPLLDNLRERLLDFVPAMKRERASAILNQARPLKARADDDQLRLSFVVETPSMVEAPPPAPLSDEELVRFITLWETWDEYLIASALSLFDTPLSLDERRDLLGLILESRSTFDEALSSHTLESDLALKQFETAWRMLGPLMRRSLTSERGLSARGPEAILQITPFFSASEALAALDRLGPLLGMEISVNGLIRLARMLNDTAAPLHYDQTYRPDLRTILGLDSEPQPVTSPGVYNRHPVDRLWAFLVPEAWGAEKTEPGKPAIDEVTAWIPERNRRLDYVKRVRELVSTIRDEPVRIKAVPQKRRAWFAQMIEATAWQESCFRQFTMAGDDFAYLRSYNGSSVGLMQINERVWRGLYEIPSLRWSVDYNVGAGVDILSLYLTRFALPKAAKKGLDLSSNDLAGLLYAMYNGGPGQFDKFLIRQSKGKLYTTDRLFAEKYNRVTQGEWDKVKRCLESR